MIRAELKPYQLEGARQIRDWSGRALLADDMGLGKTIQALYYLYKTPRSSSPTVIVCPASVKDHWKHEALAKFGLHADILSGREPPPGWGKLARPNIVVINYDILELWAPVLKRVLKPKMIILDEAHFVKDKDRGRFKNIQTLVKDVPKLLLLTGTPVCNRPKELWPLLHLLYPEKWNSFRDFAHRFCEAVRRPWGWDFRGARNLDVLHAILKDGIMIRRLKHEVLADQLKDSSRIYLPVEVDREEYEFAENELIEWIAHTKGARTASRAARAERLVRWQYLRHLTAQLKMPYIEDWIRRFLQKTNKKMCIYGVHTDIVRATHDKFRRYSTIVDGQVNGRKRSLAIQRFTHDPRCRLFFGNITAAGTGLNLVQAHLLAVLELGWTPGEMRQMEKRIDRIGQTKAPKVFYLIGKDTIEESICEIIQKKQRVVDETLDGTPDPDGMNLLDMLEEEILDKHHEKEVEKIAAKGRSRYHRAAAEASRKRRQRSRS